jgi:hypothetical protein
MLIPADICFCQVENKKWEKNKNIITRLFIQWTDGWRNNNHYNDIQHNGS